MNAYSQSHGITTASEFGGCARARRGNNRTLTMQRSVRLWLASLWLGAAVCMTAAPAAFALGFRNPDQDARATAQGEAFVAQADNPSAVYYNPGGLTQLTGTQISGGGYFFFPDFSFDDGLNSEEMNTWSLSPHIYVASDLGMEKWRFGFGFNVPYGTAVDWGDHGALRYVVTTSQMQVYNFAPTAAYQINENVSVGAGVNIYHGRIHMKQRAFLSASLEDGRGDFQGDGQAVGATVGVLWKINKQNTVGVTYRSPFTIDFDGHAEVSRVPLFLGYDTSESSASARIEFPQQVVIGYAFRPIEKLKLEVDVEWTDWDTLDDVKLHSRNTFFDSDYNSSYILPMDWQASFFYEFGVQYDLTEEWALRAGYIYSENSVPSETFSAMVPDTNRHVFSVGVGYSTKRWGVDIAYQYVLGEDRTIRDSSYTSVNGKWEVHSQAVMFTATLKF